jgi:alpha-N-arabinofuranosidase
MFGSWQLGYMSLGHYALKHNEVARAMLDVDPEIKLIGVGDAGNWSEGMLRNCYQYMDEISEHFYCQRRPDVVSHVAQIPERIRSKAEFHRRMWQERPELKEKDLRVSMDEWNYWYGPHEFGELGTRYFLQDALGIAAGVHEYARTTDIISSAFYAQTVNVIGCIKTSKTEAQWATTGLVLKLYRNSFGTIPVEVESKDAGGIDLAAAWTAERDAFTIAVVNPYADPQTIELTISGVSLEPHGTLWRIAGDDPMAYNEPGEPLRVEIEESAASLTDKLTIPTYSISVYRFELR